MTEQPAEDLATVRTLMGVVEGLFHGASRRVEIRTQINEFGLKINGAYERATSGGRILPQAVIDKQIQPFQDSIQKLRIEDQSLDEESHRAERAVQDALRELARNYAAAMPLLEEFQKVWELRSSPIDHLIKLKSLLVKAVEFVAGESIGSRGDQPVAAVACPVSRLELHRQRIETFDRLSKELAAIHRETKGYTNVAKLKQKFPQFRIWEDLSPKEQQSLIDEPFKPKAYAATITLRIEGLTSLESLRYSRRVLRKHSTSSNR